MSASDDDWPTLLAEATRELRLPLHTVLGWVQILRTADADAGTRAAARAAALAAIERNARLQAQLLDDLLDLARAAAGRLSLRLGAVDPGGAVAAAIEELRPLGAERGVLVERALDPRVGAVAADPERLEQVVRVLALASLRATPDRGVVEIRVDAAAPAGARIRVGRAGALGGSARRLVDALLALHESALTLVDGVASFTLPPARGPADERAPPLAGARILAVDDESDAREVLRALLAQHGAEVRTAGSAAEALSILSRWRPDALVSDIAMPEVDGYELMQRVRARGRTEGGFVRSVALTAYASDEDARLARHAGFDRHLPKPVDAAELVRHLVELLAR